MTKPVIAYCNGAGGSWLGHMLGSLEKNNKVFPALNQINFHTGKKSTYFDIEHNDSGVPASYTLGGLCRFNFFLNSWLKFRVPENYFEFNSFDTVKKIFVLTDDAVWRMGPIYYSTYESKIDLDYECIFKNTVSFRNQLLTILEPHWPETYINRVTQSYVDSAAAAYCKTVPNAADHLGNVNSIGWLAWCHALFLINSIDIPFNLESQLTEYCNWVLDHRDWLINQTSPYIL